MKIRRLKVGSINYSPVAGVFHLQMLKRRSLSTAWRWWRTQHIFLNISKFRKYAAIGCSPFSTTPGSSWRQQNLSSSLFRFSVDDFRAFFFFEVCFSTVCWRGKTDCAICEQLNDDWTRSEHKPNECWLSSTIVYVDWTAGYCVWWSAVNCSCDELTVMCVSLYIFVLIRPCYRTAQDLPRILIHIKE